MKLNGYKIVSEAILSSKESELIKKVRLSKPFLYLYHGTPITLIDSIKKNGLKTEYMGNYLKKYSGLDKNVIFLTSNLKYALNYSKTKMPLFHRKNGIALLCKVSTKYLEFLLSIKIFSLFNDEYMYSKNIPPEDIVWPDDRMYNLIQRKEGYLS